MSSRSVLDSKADYISSRSGSSSGHNFNRTNLSDKIRNNIPNANVSESASMVDLRRRDIFGSIVSLVGDEFNKKLD